MLFGEVDCFRDGRFPAPRMTIRHAILELCTVGLLVLSDARATTVVPPTFGEMVDRADFVFIGKVSESRSEWKTVGANRVIFTLVTFDVQETWKGRSVPAVTLQFLGGTIGDVSLVVAGVPKFNIGESVIVFVEGNEVQFCPIVGVFHGKFGVRKDANSGRDIVLKHDGRPLRDVAEIGTGEGAELRPTQPKIFIPADREPMSVDDFKTRILGRLAKHEKN